ncbi:MAG: hypothetical protein ACOYXT_21080 [Bacteroidota bacterium]
MFVPFESLPPQARVWVYQADRKFTTAEKAAINEHLKKFTESWAAHGHQLKSSYEIRFDQFVILAADESYNAASGCSIDDSVRVIKDITTFTGLDFFNRNLVAFKSSENILLIPISALKEKLAENIWNGSMHTFNNLVNTKADLDHRWLVTAGNSWLKRYLPQTVGAPRA